MERLAYMLNPWWEWRNWEDKDRDLRKFKQMEIKWVPKWIKEVSLEPLSLNFVIGPRQVGKTTGIKLLVKELLKEVTPESVFYFNCDLIADFKELRNLIDYYQAFKEANKVKTAYLFLDEVTGVEYWWRVLKGYIDLGAFETDVIVVLGSASFRLMRFSEAFAGRKGQCKTIEVLPLSFKEYLMIHQVDPKLGASSKVKVLFKKYLETGGFPRSVNRDETFLEDLILSIEKDVAKAGKSVKVLRSVLRAIIDKAPSALGYNTIASEIGVSHNTVREYVELMEDLFIIGVAYWKQGRKIGFRKEKKIFIRDPYIAKAFSEVLGVELRKECLYEWVVQEHLFRKYGEVYYWKNSYEIDCIAGDLKVEVKAGKPHRRYPKNVTVLSEDDIPFFLAKL